MIAQTQYSENYGDEENPYWKMKGDFYQTIKINLSAQECLEIMTNKTQVDAKLINNAYAQEWLVGTFFVEMNELENGEYNPYKDMFQPTETIAKHANENILSENRLVQAWWEGENNFKHAA